MNRRILLLVPLISLFAFSYGNSFDSKGTSLIKDKEVIVELNDIYGTSIESRNIVKKEFIHELNAYLDFNYDINNYYNHIGNILVMKIPSSEYSLISNLNLVKSISENKSYTADYEDFSYNPFTGTNVPDSNYSRIDMNVPDSTNDGAGTMIAILDNSFNIDHEMFKDLSTNLRYSKNQITNLKATSGFNAQSAGYKNNKIPFYFNYGANDLNMTYNLNTNFHGEHVAGIAGANNTIIGMAPNAQLALMKVTNSNGSFLDGSILKALEDCAILNVDAINMSFGNSIYDFELSQTYIDVFNNLKDLGIQTNIANGNEGRESFDLTAYQNFVTSDVETGILGSFNGKNSVNSVGALNVLEDEMILTSAATYSGTNFRIREQMTDHEYNDGTSNKTQLYDPMYPFYSLIASGSSSRTLDYEIVPNLGAISDYQNIDVKNKVAVIERGDISFVEKVRNAVSKGAIAVLIYNGSTSKDQVGYMNLDALEKTYYVPIGYMKSSDGALLKSQTIKKIIISKELSANYSSDGAASDLTLKPDLSAPGTSIYSGIGPATDKYAYYSGTSMATPNITGAMANILSNKTFSSEASRSEYRKTLVRRMMSTSTPLVEASGAYYSPRKVGPGRINVSSAINSKVYLEGNVLEKAKVELKNNDEIKNGIVNFDLKTINESTSIKEYNATLVIEAPELTKIDQYYGDLAKYNYKTDKDVLLTKVTSKVTVPVGESTLNFKASITEDNKKYLANFENGTYLEGYVILDSISDSYDLVAPYMGFYGDYNSESVLEPFSFEKDSSKVYGSDLAETMAKDYSITTAKFGSYMMGSNVAITANQKNGILKNTMNITNYGTPLVYDSMNDYIKVGYSGVSTHLAIQTYVNRNCIDNSFTLINKSTNKAVYSGYLNNLLDDTSSLTKHSLVKSIATKDLISGRYILNRGFASIDLVDSNEKLLYEEGLYELRFDFTLASGATQSKSYNLNIINVDKDEPPVIVSREKIINNGETYLRIRFNGNTMNKVYADGESIKYSQDTTSYFVDLKISDYSSKTSLVISFVDIYNKSNYYLINVSSIGNGGYGVISNELSVGDTLETLIGDKITENDGDSYYYTYLIKSKDDSNVLFTNSYQVAFEVPSNYLADSKQIIVYDSDTTSSSESITTFTLNDGVVTASTRSGLIRVKFMKDNSGIDINNGLSNGTVIGLIIGGVCILIGVLIAVFVLRSIRRHI